MGWPSIRPIFRAAVKSDPGAGQAEVSPGAAICWLGEKLPVLSGLSFSNETGMTIVPTTRVVVTRTDVSKKSAWHTVRAV